MKTWFAMGFTASPFSERPRLGQETLSDKDKSALYDQLVDTDGKLIVVEDWKKNHPNVAADLGADAQRFGELETAMQGVRGAAHEMEKRTEAAEAAVVTLEDLGQTQNWMTYVHEMYVIVANHTGKHPSAAALPAPPAPAPAVNPVVIGIGAVGLLTLIIVALK